MSDSIPSGMTSPPLPSRDHRPRYPYRAKSGRHWAGVAQGLGNYFGIDANWIRLGFGLATFAGGLGLALYCGAWLALPEEGDPEAGYSLFRAGNGRTRALLGIALLCIPFAVVVGDGENIFDGFTGAIALIVAGVALWIWRMEALKQREQSSGEWPPPVAAPPAGRANTWAPPSSLATTRQGPTASATVAPTARTLPPPRAGGPDTPAPSPRTASHLPPHLQPHWPAHVQAHRPASVPPRPVAPRPPARPPEPRSPLGALTFAASLLVFAGAVLVDRLGWVTVTAPTALALALAVTAAGLIAGIWLGRARGVIAWGILLSFAVVVTSAVEPFDLPFTAGIGEKHRTPLTVAEVEPVYELTIGDLSVDLSRIDVLPGQIVNVEVNLGIGRAQVWVPDDVALDVKGSAGAGSVDILGHQEDGLGTDYSQRKRGDESQGTIVLDVSTAMGEVVVAQRSGS